MAACHVSHPHLQRYRIPLSGISSQLLKHQPSLPANQSRFSHALATKRRGWVSVTARIQVDRRRHLEELFRRQLEDEQRRAEMLVTCPLDCVREVRKLDELEEELTKASEINELVVVDFYNSACGACKYMLPPLVSLCKAEGCSAESECDVATYLTAGTAAGVRGGSSTEIGPRSIRFLKHNIRDDYDDLTDIARLYRVKFVPTFALFADGARIDQVSTRSPAKLMAMLSLWLNPEP